MKTLKIIFTIILFGGASLVPAASVAQTTTTGASSKPAASQATSTTAKQPAAKPPATKPAATGASHQSIVALKDQKAKNSYALGMNVGRAADGQIADFDLDAFVQGVRDVLAGGKTLLTPDELAAVMTQLQPEISARRAEKMKIASDANKIAGAAFLAENKSKDGVVTLPSGLQYKIITEGTGPKPALTDVVVCNYRGTLLDGKEFDSSYKRGQPSSFPVNRVIKGWTEALQLMSVGSKWQLFIPSELAYAERGAGADIGPGATLVFEVELISIQGK
jgi:FKBP-type peptidyl-prolyl cis-trans isomerase FklB